MGPTQTPSGPVSNDSLAMVRHLSARHLIQSFPRLHLLYTRAPTAGSATQLSGSGAESVRRYLEPQNARARDAVGIVGGNPSGHGVVVHALKGARTRLGRSERRLWTCVAAHLASGYRLRLGESPMEAVVTPAGRVDHAQGAATGASERGALGEAARAMDKARGRMRRAEPAEALTLWQALVAGQWSLLEQIDSDGRRYFFAKRNAPEVRPWGDLTEREREVLAYAAEGHAHKMIAYELGIGVPTVSHHLAHAARKLGVPSRLDLVRLYRRRDTSGGS
jgi:DNA-binding CsgD family transcriptional regulator